MIYTVSRPPTDDHTYEMFQQWVKKISGEHQAFYMWSNPPQKVLKFLDNIKIDKPLVIIGIKDLLDGWNEFNYWQQSQQLIPEKISNTVKKYPNTQFILFTSLENLHLELRESNLHIIPWGGDLVNQESSYRNLLPVLDKNFNSDRTFISLNRNRRDHRIVALSYLLSQGYNKFGHITYLSNKIALNHEPSTFLDRISWEFDELKHDVIRSKMIDGYDLLMSLNVDNQDEFEIYNHYGLRSNDNVTNFNLRLRSEYQKSFVEIVSESSFCAPSFNVTEKTANSFFACNFPIFLGGSGLVQHLRDIGLDLFDDLIDHSYDTITNPFDRIVAALDNNQRLLTDAPYVKQIWAQCRPRFESNYEKIRTVYDWYDARTERTIDEVIQKIC
jgi:Txe/YoeB family toxin of Txe-Axe toxin-antitoxin module